MLSITNKQSYLHYNDKVLMNLPRKVHKKLGWINGQSVLDVLKACFWFDGDIDQTQTILFANREAHGKAEKLVCNKHSAVSTGTKKPYNLTPAFRLVTYPELGDVKG